MRAYTAVIRVHDHAGNVMETTRTQGRFQGVVIQLLVAPCSRIRYFKRNLTEQRLRPAPRCGEAVVEIVLIHNTGWVSPRLIPCSPPSLLSKPVFNIPT